MRHSLSLVTVLLFAAAVWTGCSAAFRPTQSPSSFPVTSGVSTTNEAPITGWLEVVKAANQQYNSTVTRGPTDAALYGLVSLSSAVVGWLARHKSGQEKRTT